MCVFLSSSELKRKNEKRFDASVVFNRFVKKWKKDSDIDHTFSDVSSDLPLSSSFLKPGQLVSIEPHDSLTGSGNTNTMLPPIIIQDWKLP